MLAIEPRGLDGADEELRAVGAGTVDTLLVRCREYRGKGGDLPGVGHGEDTGASVRQVEVLVLELLAVDGLAAGALLCISYPFSTDVCVCGGYNVRCRG